MRGQPVEGARQASTSLPANKNRDNLNWSPLDSVLEIKLERTDTTLLILAIRPRSDAFSIVYSLQECNGTSYFNVIPLLHLC